MYLAVYVTHTACSVFSVETWGEWVEREVGVELVEPQLSSGQLIWGQ